MHQTGRNHPNNDFYLKTSFLGVKIEVNISYKYVMSDFERYILFRISIFENEGPLVL